MNPTTRTTTFTTLATATLAIVTVLLGQTSQAAEGGADYELGVDDSKEPSVTVGATLEEQQDLLDGGGSGDGESDVRYYRATVHYCLLDDLDSTVLREACTDG
ncbi:hypothetical protein, partial [Isoptericola chiayiensis]|uniref:hypothetical protein n=1 Tax=Isoptericola chiayiensis TaxID=579446 RepID=UPI001551CDDC